MSISGIRKYFFYLFFLYFQCASASSEILKVLTYDSFVGKKSMGEYIQTEWKKECSTCQVEFVGTQDLSSIYAALAKNPQKYDLVLGLDQLEYQWSREKNLIVGAELFEYSPYALMVDTERLPQEKWPRTWKQLTGALGKNILIQDPRLSQVGRGWVRVLFEMKTLSENEYKKIIMKTLPSWSVAYAQFLKGESLAVWSYLTSEAYHRCEGSTSKPRYRALPLAEGYPVQESWVGWIRKNKTTEKFMNFLMSEKVQKEIPLRNSMFPGQKNIPLPECFQGLQESFPVWKEGPQPPTEKEFQKMLDRWSLM